MNKTRRILAIIGICLLVALYIVTIFAALTASESSMGLFMASIAATIVIPVIIWLFTLFYKLSHKKDNE
ncbi:MAG: hypothetical protein IKX99_05295 [Lachnospiraceae bacterium]|nr:hypothetical protein [Lachnospiraceae bacterium]MBR5789500.1 hypothetical protein [Lachnospiraceae bacterium]